MRCCKGDQIEQRSHGANSRHTHCLRGPSFIVSATNVVTGESEVGSVSAKAPTKSTMVTSEAKGPLTCAVAKEPVWVLRVAGDRVVEQPDGYDQQDLQEICFPLADAGVMANGECPGNRAQSRDVPRTLVHCRCGKGVLLSRPFRSEKGLRIVEVTQE